MTSAPPRLQRMPALDGIRGIAVAAVIWFHFGHLAGGYLGVDAFFTLSGFLITSLLISEHRQHGRIRLQNFWVRRARRLLPAVICTLSAVLIVARTIGPASELHRLRLDALATLFYVANWRAIFANNSYWDLFAAPSPLEHMWSLAIEEQFYLVWPVVVIVALKIGRGQRIVLGCVIATLTAISVSLMWVLYSPGGSTTRAYLGTGTRAASILVGAGLAVLVARFGPSISERNRLAVDVLAVVTLAPLCWAWIRVSGTTEALYRGGLFACAIGVAVVIAAAALRPSGVIASIFSIAPLRALGTISYGLYLWHWPLKVWLTPDRIHTSGWTLDIVRLAATFAVAVFSYFVIERPIRHGALRGHIAFGVAVASFAAVAIGAFVLTTTNSSVAAIGGVPSPINFPQQNDSIVDPPPTVITSAGSHIPRIVVFGDSVALTVAAGFDQVKSEFTFDFLNRGFLGCGVARGSGKTRLAADKIVAEHPDCHSWDTRWPRDISVYQPTAVLLVEGAWDVNDRQIDSNEFFHPCQVKFDQWFGNELQAAFHALSQDPAAKVFVASIPYMRQKDVPGADERDKRIDCLNAVYRSELAKTKITTIDLASWVCPTKQSCVEKVDGTVLRPDGVHYDGPGGAIVARWLLKQILPT